MYRDACLNAVDFRPAFEAPNQRYPLRTVFFDFNLLRKNASPLRDFSDSQHHNKRSFRAAKVLKYIIRPEGVNQS
jgi:hypothetical protein